VTAAYEPDNIFAKILRGEIPCHRVFEDETLLVMMDVFPQSRGHTLVIPKAASRNILDADAEAVARVARHLPRLGRAVLERIHSGRRERRGPLR